MWKSFEPGCAMDSDCHCPRHNTGMREGRTEREKKMFLYRFGIFSVSVLCRADVIFPLKRTMFHLTLVSFRDD